jgi:serine/threonine-protein kinase
MREFEEALRYYDRAIELNPDNYNYVWDKATVMVSWEGNLDAAREIMSVKPEGDPSMYHLYHAFLSLWARDYEKAEEHARQWGTASDLFRVGQMVFLSRLEAMEGGPEAAREELEKTRDAIQSLLKETPLNEVLRSWLAVNLALQGEHEAAANEVRLMADLVAKDRFSGPQGLQMTAEVYAIIGRHDEAIDILERLLDTVYEDAITPHVLAIDPVWDPLRNHPRFQKLLPPKNI